VPSAVAGVVRSFLVQHGRHPAWGSRFEGLCHSRAVSHGNQRAEDVSDDRRAAAVRRRLGPYRIRHRMVSSTLPIAASICGASRTGTFMALPLFTDGQGWH